MSDQVNERTGLCGRRASERPAGMRTGGRVDGRANCRGGKRAGGLSNGRSDGQMGECGILANRRIDARVGDGQSYGRADGDKMASGQIGWADNQGGRRSGGQNVCKRRVGLRVDDLARGQACGGERARRQMNQRAGWFPWSVRPNKIIYTLFVRRIERDGMIGHDVHYGQSHVTFCACFI